MILPRRTEQLDEEDAMFALAEDMKRVAGLAGFYSGFLRTPEERRYMKRCTRSFETVPRTRLLFTRDAGMHACGWWKNPDYSQCLHLSLSFADAEAMEHAPKHKGLTERWVRLFFGDWTSLVWCEPPFSPEGKLCDVWHYRVFTSPDFRVPILPRGEVYSREFTEAGWKSWSDVHGGDRIESAHE